MTSSTKGNGNAVLLLAAQDRAQSHLCGVRLQLQCKKKGTRRSMTVVHVALKEVSTAVCPTVTYCSTIEGSTCQSMRVFCASKRQMPVSNRSVLFFPRCAHVCKRSVMLFPSKASSIPDHRRRVPTHRALKVTQRFLFPLDL